MLYCKGYMKYSIITPTYKRPELLKRCVDSLFLQEHNDWEMIIVNDSPDFDYDNIEKYLSGLSEQRIRYFKNTENMGVNFSRNYALKNISVRSDYIIFLDDDDFFFNDSLVNIENILKENKYDWLVTNRAFENRRLVKIRNDTRESYEYFWDMLIFKNFSGDVTHTINSKIARKYKFEESVKNGEEWTYFIQLPSNITYKNINTTDTDGYLEGGLTDKLKNKYKENTEILWSNIKNIKMFIILILRQINIIVRK